jgi:pyridoxal phosphate enzyme (YggS family)
VSDLGLRLDAVRAGIADAARAAGRDPASLTTIVVTKFHPASLVRELSELGVTQFGESRHQEAQPKIASLADLDATWHFVGQVQGKKARQVRAYADVIHSVDRESLIDSLAGEPTRQVFLQVNLTDDPERGGAEPADVPRIAELVAAAPGLELLGLMAVAPLGEEPRRAFARVRELSERVRETVPEASALSMGMSGDYAEAILEGATHLRIGTAITGNRPDHG